ncbi:MAG: RNA polymerase sigma factor [Patescibacteria group bacterium]|nr:RNA polymerase sigma factor [Patescibacteria group bacterium]
MRISKKNCRKLSDEELVKKSLQDIKYFACLFERYEKKLVRYILRISSFSEEEADDVLQEAFLKIWKNLNKFDSSLKFSSWAYRIVHNTTVSEWRKSKSCGKDQQIKIDDELFENLPSKIDLTKEFQKGDSKREIRKILNNLPEKYSEILVLKFLEEKSYDEISDILKKPPGTIATLIHRAKKAFREEAGRKNILFEL